MRITYADRLKRALQLMKIHRQTIKSSREGLIGKQMPDILWLILRYDYLLREIDVRIGALEKEIRIEEERNRNDGDGD